MERGVSGGLKVEKWEMEGRAWDEILYNERRREKETKSKGVLRVRVRKKGESETLEKEKKSKRENHVINIGKSKMKRWRIEITPVAFFPLNVPPPP